MKNHRATARMNKSVYDYRTSDNPYNGKWQSKFWGQEVYHLTVEAEFKYNTDNTAYLLFDMRSGHSGYLGCIWVTNQFENEGIYPYVAETETGKAKLFEYDRDAVKWLQSQH